MLLNGLITRFPMDKIATEQKACSLLGLDQSLGIIRIDLLFRQVDDGDIGSFASHQDSH